MMAEGGGTSKLSEEQIFECLKSLNVQVKMNELKSPNREFIIRVFESFLKDLQIDISNPILRPWAATKHIEDGEIYEEGQLLSLLAISVNHVTSYLGLNITIKDIIEPKPKRTKKILNYLLVFWNYYLQMYACFNAVEETFTGSVYTGFDEESVGKFVKTDLLETAKNAVLSRFLSRQESERKKREDLLLENESLDEKIADKLNIFQNMQPSKEELQRTCSAKEEKCSKLMKESENLQAEYLKLKTKEVNLKEQISTAELQIVKAKETLEELSQLILSSPKQELINTEIKNLEKKIKDIDAKTKEGENAYKDEMKKLQLLEEYQKDEEKVKNSLSEIQDINKELSESVKAMVDVHQQINDVEDKLKQLEMDLERKDDWQLQQEQKSAKLLLNKRKQLETLRELAKMNQSEETKIKKQLEFVKSAVQDAQDNIDTETNHVLDVIKRCEEADTKSKEREIQFKSKLKEISNLFNSDCDEVMENIKNVFPYEPEVSHSQK